MMRFRSSPAVILLLLAALLIVITIISIDLGVTPMSVGQVTATLLGRGTWIDNLVVFDLRMPRIVLSILIGIGMATSGTVLQGITRNDLAGPDTIGTNAGSGLGIAFLLVAYPTASTTIPWLLPGGAVAGAIAITALVFSLAYQHGHALPSRLLLVGIAVGFAAHAAMLLLSLRMGFTTYNYVVSWMSGTLAAANWSSVLLLLPCCVVLVPAAISRARILNVILLGDDVAASLGVLVERNRLMLIGITTILTSACVSIGGHIGFLGLAAPHLARRMVGDRHGLLFPVAAVCGAILLLLADTLGRRLFSPIEIPAGVLVGILGGIYFLYLLTTIRG